jgi:hypothetical protein
MPCALLGGLAVLCFPFFLIFSLAAPGYEGGISYVDAGGIIHRWLAGDNVGTKQRGDGQWFYNDPLSPKVTKVRSVTLDRHGNMVTMENNSAFVRRIHFDRLNP